MGLFEMMLQDNVVAKVDATRWASERFRFHVLFLDVLLQMTETVEKYKKWNVEITIQEKSLTLQFALQQKVICILRSHFFLFFFW